MAVPKRKISKSNRDKRRGHDKLSAPNFSVCPECGQSKLPHRICKCGYYKGEQLVTPKE